MSNSLITPVIYLGAPRNGTTWLGNILIKSFKVSSAYHPLHYGIHESNIYRNYKFWGNLESLNNYISFLELYSSSDYFKLVDGNKDSFYEKKHSNFYSFFFELMDQYALSNNSNHWCTKLDPDIFLEVGAIDKLMSQINLRYDNVKYISIKREYPEYLRSYINMGGHSYKKRLKNKFVANILAAARYKLNYRKIQKIINNNSALHIDFQELKDNYEKQINRIEEYLGLSYFPSTLDIPRNSSFDKPKTAESFSITSKLIFNIINVIPSIDWLILKLNNKITPKRNPFSHRLLKSKFFKEELHNEFRITNNSRLLKEITPNT